MSSRGLLLALAFGCALALCATVAVGGAETAAVDSEAAETAAVGGVETTPPDASALGQSESGDLVPQTQEELDPDATVTRIVVSSDGSAEWRLTIRMQLDSNQSVADFEAFQAAFEANRSTYVGRFQDRMTGVVDNAETATGREMTASAFEAEIGIQEVPRRSGFVTYRFRWDGFAPVENDVVTVGDVFGGGLFLEADDILIVEGPSGYDSTGVDPTPDTTDGQQLQWDGPESFDDQRPRIEFAQTENDTAGESDTGGSSEIPSTALLGLVLVAAVGTAVVYVGWRRSDDGETGTPTGERTTPDGEQSAAGSDDPDAGAETGADATSESEAAGDRDGADPLGLGALATDGDRVRALLEAEGGRMRQKAIADRLGWSASKTSRVVSEMADDDEIEKLRIGRENVIDHPADDGDESDTP